MIVPPELTVKTEQVIIFTAGLQKSIVHPIGKYSDPMHVVKTANPRPQNQTGGWWPKRIMPQYRGYIKAPMETPGPNTPPRPVSGIGTGLKISHDDEVCYQEHKVLGKKP